MQQSIQRRYWYQVVFKTRKGWYFKPLVKEFTINSDAPFRWTDVQVEAEKEIIDNCIMELSIVKPAPLNLVESRVESSTLMVTPVFSVNATLKLQLTGSRFKYTKSAPIRITFMGWKLYGSSNLY